MPPYRRSEVRNLRAKVMKMPVSQALIALRAEIRAIHREHQHNEKRLRALESRQLQLSTWKHEVTGMVAEVEAKSPFEIRRCECGAADTTFMSRGAVFWLRCNKCDQHGPEAGDRMAAVEVWNAL